MDFSPGSATPAIIFSTAEDYFDAARQELRAAFGKAAQIERLGRDTGSFTAPGVAIAQVAEVCQIRPIVFVQHLMREMARLPTSTVAADMTPVVAMALRLVREQGIAAPFALQVWFSSGTTNMRYQSDELWRQIAAELTAHGYTVARGGQPIILSVCLTPQVAILGINITDDALTDWPGGRVGLAKSAAQISRAEFKLEELRKVFAVAWPSAGTALDLGASPGGWTRVLRHSGLTVWAVDPAALDPRLATDPGVHHIPTTAHDFLATTTMRFDIVVNDMRMDPDPSCQVMLRAARHLKPGGLAVVTLKLFPRNPVAQVHRALASLHEAYTIVHARQLYHNRHEVTVVAQRAGHHEPMQSRASTGMKSDSSR